MLVQDARASQDKRNGPKKTSGETSAKRRRTRSGSDVQHNSGKAIQHGWHCGHMNNTIPWTIGTWLRLNLVGIKHESSKARRKICIAHLCLTLTAGTAVAKEYLQQPELFRHKTTHRDFVVHGLSTVPHPLLS